MSFPEFPEDALDRPDDYLGKLLLAWYIAAQADFVGLSIYRIPQAFGERVVEYARTAEADTASNAALEKALHKAANGEFEAAVFFYVSICSIVQSPSNLLLIGEGVATMLSAKKAGGHSVVAGLSNTNLPAVAKAIS